MNVIRRRSSRNLDRRIRWVLLFSVVAFALFMISLYQQKKNQEYARTDMRRTYSVISKMENVRTMLFQTESISRGYLLIKRPDALTRLKDLHRQLPNAVAELERWVASKDRDNLAYLATLVQKKIAFQDSFIRSGPALFQNTRAVNDARANAEAATATINDMIEREEAGLNEKTAVSERRTQTGILLATLGAFSAFVLVLLILLQLNSDISRRRKAEGELLLSEEKYRKIIENAGVVMSTADVEGKITFANNQVLQLTGYSADELLGKHFSILVDPSWLPFVTGFYYKQFAERTTATILEFLTRNRAGEPIWVEQFAQLLFNDDMISGFQCMVRDISEKKKIELQLGRSEQKGKENEYRLLSILENTTALIFIKDLQGRYVVVNKRFKEILGLTDEMVIGKTDFEIAAMDNPEYYQRSDEIIINTHGVIETEEVVETREGKRNLLVVKFPLLDDKRNMFGISGIATDITDRVQSHQQLQAALHHAKEARQLQEQFLANMSHEIRTPMNGIQGMTALLLESDLTAEQREFAQMIRHSLNNLTAIVNDILDYSNIRAGKLTVDRIAFNINDTLDAVKIQFSNQAALKRLSFRIDVDKDVPLLVTGDPYRLRQVLVSLVDNAIKFTETGSVSVQVSLQAIRDDVAELAFTVSDTGIGIDHDKQSTIFESFAQANMDISRSYGGAGLGLAISKGLVQVLGGDISVESRPGEGSVFRFTLPYQLPVSLSESAPADELKRKLNGKRFLVVEDNEVNQHLIRFVLERVGGISDIAANGQEAIDMFRREAYDLVIMDLQMPVMDGYATAAYIRRNLHSDIPIIALTATALKGDQEKCRAIGMNDFMLKPFDFMDLYRRLVNLLYHQQNPGSTTSARMDSQEPRLYDMSLLQELGDNESILDVLTMFLQNTPGEMEQLAVFAADRNWSELQKLAHKIKGAVGIVQAMSLAKLLAAIEENAREKKDEVALAEQIAGISGLFDRLKTALELEVQQLGE